MSSEKVIHTVEKYEHDKVFENDFLSIRQNGHYLYAERKGIDSVAFILLAKNIADERRIGIVNEVKPPLNNKKIQTAFGGSIDQPHYKDDLRVLVKDEVLEEAGFDIKVDDVEFVGKVLCSTQMNQFVYLFAVHVDKSKQGEKTTDNPMEMESSVAWIETSKLFSLEDWKAPLIFFKLLSGKSATIIKEEK